MELEDGRYVLSFFSLTRACACETKKINRTPGTVNLHGRVMRSRRQS